MSLQEILRLIRLYGKKITVLPEATVLDGTEWIEIVQDGINKKARISLLTTVGLHWVHKGDWDLSANTLPSGAESYNTYYVTAAGDIDFGLGAEEVPTGSLILFRGGDNQDGANWELI